jgi:hypothetical protein
MFILFVAVIGLGLLLAPVASRATAAADNPDGVIVGPKVQIERGGSKGQLVYFRDDAQRACFAFFLGYPESLTSVSCTETRWP